MEYIPTKEQEAILNADLVPQCVIACPGSGKTATAVRRLVEIRRRLGDSRDHVALFSYSNIAVETFRQQFTLLRKALPNLSQRVLIETVDSFMTTYLLRPHGARAMGTARQPFLVQGSEPFLKGHKIFYGTYPHDITELRVKFRDDGSLDCFLQAPGRQPVPIDEGKAVNAIEKLGRTGAYTFELARYWSIQTLAEDGRLLEILCRRFPHILVDEAQDIGPLHGVFISLLAQGGSSVSLVGDPNQGIYDFADADGTFLREYSAAKGVNKFSLSQNRRSVSSIIDTANSLIGTKSTPFRQPGPRRHGVYYLRYKESDLDALMSSFAAMLVTNNYGPQESIVLCRGNTTVEKLNGGGKVVGRGATELFARAAVSRDRNRDIAMAFDCVVSALLKLLGDQPETLRKDVLDSTSNGDSKTLRRLLWSFLRSATGGLPQSTLHAKSKWHPTLKKRVDELLSLVETNTKYVRLASWANNVTVSGLLDEPLWKSDLVEEVPNSIRVDTVHQAKGEGIPVVLYLARTSDLTNLLRGATTEDGRVGYVAVTRAMDLLLLGVPSTTEKSTIDALELKGFKAWVH